MSSMVESFQLLGPVGWPLLLCSLAVLTISFERVAFLLGLRRYQAGHLAQLSQQLQQDRHLPKALRDEAITTALETVKRPYYQGIRLLKMVGMLSPMLGLLGTILGIIAAFRVVAAQSGPVSPALIADGLWEAMLTTATGLIIALPALFLAQCFSAISDRQLARLCLQLNQQSLAMEREKAALTSAPKAMAAAPFQRASVQMTEAA